MAEPSTQLPPAPSDVADLVAAVRRLVAVAEGARLPAAWFSVDGAANYASVSPKSIRNMIAAGKLTPSRAVRGKILIDRRELDSVLRAACGLKLRRGRGIRPANGTEEE